MKAAFIANGELFVWNDGDLSPVTSLFITESEKRTARSRSIDGWKENASTWGDAWMRPQFQQFSEAGNQRKAMRFTNVSRDQNGTLAYSIGMPGGGGLFRYQPENRSERRLMHRNGFQPRGIAARDRDGLLVCTVEEEGGTSSIAIAERDGLHLRRITSGDTRDEAPCWWHDGEQDWIYFHSSGVARSEDGLAWGFGPAAICRMRTDRGDVETIVHSESHDFLQPRVTSDGTLYCIRRPSVPVGRPPLDFMTFVKDAVLLPYRLLRAAFYFANFMSVMFSGQPLTSQDLHPTQRRAGEKLMLWGKMVDTQTKIKRGTGQNAHSLAPDNWELVRIGDQEEPEVVARGVLCFDLGPNGVVLFSDGVGLHAYDRGQTQTITSHAGIVQVAAL